MATDFHYVPLTGPISGVEVLQQTERAINELGQDIADGTATAEEALRIANEAAATATEALDTANTAQTTADNAQIAADNAQASADAAQGSADAAQNMANEALDTAADAKTTAEGAATDASNALATAEEAQTAAENAQVTADNAQGTANQAETTANEANATANNALGLYRIVTGFLPDAQYQDAERVFIQDITGTGIPVELVSDVYMDVKITDSYTECYQHAWSSNYAGHFERWANITGTLNDSTQDIPFICRGGAEDQTATLTFSTSSGAFNTPVFSGGTFAQTGTGTFSISGTCTWNVGAITDGVILINGVEAATMSGGTWSLQYTSIDVNDGVLLINSISGTSTVALNVTYILQNVTRSVTWEPWREFGGGGGGGSVPYGVIVMWSGSIATVPDGWALCDGTNETPDLRDRFIVAAGNTYAPGDNLADSTHTHDITVAATVLTIAQIPSHTHGVGTNGYFQTGQNYEPRVPGASNNNSSTARGGTTGHTHTGSADAVVSLPPYYALAYIMKV